MNRKNKQRNSQNPQSDKEQPTSGRFVLQDNVKAIRELVRAINAETNRQKQEAINPNSSADRQINEQQRSNRIAITSSKISKKALWVSKLALGVSIAYFIVTALIFGVTRNSVNVANKSVIISENALAESRTEFSLINEPFIEIDSIQIHQISPFNKNLGLFFLITNLKPIAVKIYGLATGVKIATTPGFLIPEDTAALKRAVRYELDTAKVNKYFNKYITKEAPIPGFTQVPPDYGAKLDSLYHGQEYLYLVGVVKYQNLLFKKTRYYYFEMEIKPKELSPAPYSIFLYNENE